MKELLNIRRLRHCTEMSNVSLCHAIDKITIGNDESPEAWERLLKAVEDDMQWNPWHYSKEDRKLVTDFKN